MDRRGFLGSILALGVAPAIVRAESLMRCAGVIVVPGWVDVGGNRFVTDPHALQAALDSARGIDKIVLLPGVRYPMPRELRITHRTHIDGPNTVLKFSEV